MGGDTRRRLLFGAAALTAAALLSCSSDDGTTAGPPAPRPPGTNGAPATNPQRSAAGADVRAFCSVYAALEPMVESASQESIEAADLAAIVERVGAVEATAPSEIAADAATMADGLRALDAMAKVAPDLNGFRVAAMALDATRFDAAGRAVKAWTEQHC